MRRHVLTATALAVIGGSTGSAHAEGMLDIYLGRAFTADSLVSYPTFPASGIPASWDDSIAAGIRGGYWFDGVAKWVGLGLDLSYFSAQTQSSLLDFGFDFFDMEFTEFHIVTVTPMVMLRVPLFTSERYEGGRVAPYFGIGPGLFVPILTNDSFILDEVGHDVGLDLRIGVATQVARHFGFFVEYRRTDFDVDVTDSFDDNIQTQLKTNHFNAGIALRF